MIRKKLGRLMAMALALGMMLGMVPAFAAGETADSVYLNGNIYTMDDDNPHATAMAIKGDKLLYVGTDEGAKAYIGSATQVVDLEGQTVIPGLIEGHMHVGNLGQTMLMIDAFWKPKDVILQAVKEAAEAAEPGEWIQGRGWMNTVWEDDSFPSKEDLDAVAPNNPVSLQRADAHMFWFNSMALDMAGVTKDTPNPQGGEILKTEDGEVLGCLTDTAASIVRAIIPSWTDDQLKQAAILAQEQLFSYGFTSVLDAGASVHQLDLYKEQYASGDLKLRVYPLVMLSSTEGPEADYIRTTKPTGMLYDNHLHIAGVKIIGDGSLGARSAAMLEEYSDRAGYTGEYRFTDEEAYQVIKLAYDNGYQTGVHAIGDGTNNQVLDVYERLMKENPREDPRMRLEHFQIVTPDDIDRAIELGVLPAMQFTHATSDWLVAEDRVGSERIKSSYAWRTIIDKGSIIIGGSDAPVELVNPYHGLYAGVTRMDKDCQPEGGWYANEKVTREEALKAFTIWAAYGMFEEDIKGSLEAGKLADFVIIDRDYMTCPETDIKDIQALVTVSGGEVVYTKNTSEPTVTWQGKPITFNSKLVTGEYGTLYAPVSDVTSFISAGLTKDGGKAVVTYGEKSVELDIKTVNGVDYVALRALFEGIGYNVTWCQSSMTASTSRMLSSQAVESTPAQPVDEYSFNLGNFDGTVGAFCDVIMTGAKALAFSDPFYPEDEAVLTPYVSKKCEGYGVKYYIDKDLLLTKLFASVDMDGAWVYIIYQDDAVLDQYLALKAEEKAMIAAGTYTEEKQVDLATRYGKLMGYSDEHIAASIAGE